MDRPLPRIYLNWTAEYDWLIALEFGRVDDGQPAGNWEGVSESFGFLRDAPDGPYVGFKVLGFSEFEPEDEEVAGIWEGPRFDVPVLGLSNANAGEIILATRSLFGGSSTINRHFFEMAIDAEGQEALDHWLSCLQAGDSMAHFGLGYTLHELGRYQEAYRHLRHYTEIAPAGAWNWCWLGKAAVEIGEVDEARTAFQRAIELEADDQETDAPGLLSDLESSASVAAPDEPGRRERIRGCLLGGAIGDALGAPVEFSGRDELLRRFGARSVSDYLEDEGQGHITDDTQMTLFTAEGVIRSRVRFIGKGLSVVSSVVDHAYSRWLETQGLGKGRWEEWETDGWLSTREELHVARAPGNTCIAGLQAPEPGSIEEPTNDSKGCGALMRAAPIGMFSEWSIRVRFRIGAETGALTHGHPTGYLAAGFMAYVVGELVEGRPMEIAIAEAREELLRYDGHEELLAAVDAAVANAREHGLPNIDQIEEFGEGWVAEEALGIALWIALTGDDVRDALSAAVTHAGDSDSTGAITGNLLGAARGEAALPSDLVKRLGERGVVEAVADDVVELLGEDEPELTPEVEERYPGW